MTQLNRSLLKTKLIVLLCSALLFFSCQKNVDFSNNSENDPYRKIDSLLIAKGYHKRPMTSSEEKNTKRNLLPSDYDSLLNLFEKREGSSKIQYRGSDGNEADDTFDYYSENDTGLEIPGIGLIGHFYGLESKKYPSVFVSQIIQGQEDQALYATGASFKQAGFDYSWGEWSDTFISGGGSGYLNFGQGSIFGSLQEKLSFPGYVYYRNYTYKVNFTIDGPNKSLGAHIKPI